jgi:hypothetical protein
MSRKSKFHLIFSACVLFITTAFSWLIVGETSPLDEYFLWHVDIPNAWRMLHFIPFIASVVATGEHSGNKFVFFAAFAIQWFIIGLALSFVVSAFWNKSSE